MITGANGVLWLSRNHATVGLVVRDGVVVQAPPYAARWAMGHDIDRIYASARGHGYTVFWQPDRTEADHG